MKNHFKRHIDILTETFANFDSVTSNRLLNDCLNAIKGGHSIVTTALGKNVPICEKFVGTLNSLSIRARFMHTSSAIHGDLGILEPGDLVILVSKSGSTEETLSLAKLLKARMTVNWLLTCNNKSRVGKIVNNEIVIPLTHEGDPWNLVPNMSSVVFLVFLQNH